MRKRVMVIGPTGCGKTTLVNQLNEVEVATRSTQEIIYGKHTIDTPGTYINNQMHNHIIATSQNASHILLLIDQTKCEDIYPPGFAKVFRIPVIGVVTKCDLKKDNASKCVELFKKIGVSEPQFHVSNRDDVGIELLKKHLFLSNRKKQLRG